MACHLIPDGMAGLRIAVVASRMALRRIGIGHSLAGASDFGRAERDLAAIVQKRRSLYREEDMHMVAVIPAGTIHRAKLVERRVVRIVCQEAGFPYGSSSRASACRGSRYLLHP